MHFLHHSRVLIAQNDLLLTTGQSDPDKLAMTWHCFFNINVSRDLFLLASTFCCVTDNDFFELWSVREGGQYRDGCSSEVYSAFVLSFRAWSSYDRGSVQPPIGEHGTNERRLGPIMLRHVRRQLRSNEFRLWQWLIN